MVTHDESHRRTAVPMSRLSLAAPLLLAFATLLAPWTTRGQAHAQVVAVRGTPDSVAVDAGLARARRQATDGDLAGARLVLDSLATVAEPTSMRLAEVLFWRATYAQTAAGAERDYRRIVIEHPLSPRTEDALMRLAQLELARGDHQMAVRHLERLVLEHPESPNRARARYWTARAWMDAGEVAKGCTALGEALVSSGGTDAELRNQVRYAGQRCPKGWDAAANAPTVLAAGKLPVPLTVVETTTVAAPDPARSAVEPPRQGMQPPKRDSVTTPAPAPSVVRPAMPAHMPPSLGASGSATAPAPSPSAATSTLTSTTTASAPPRVDSAAGRGAPPNTNIAPPTSPTVTTGARPASPARPAVVVPPLATPPRGVGTSAVAGTVVGAPRSAPASTQASPPRSQPAPTATPTAPPASTPAPATALATTSARSGTGAAAGPRRTIYTVQLAAYDTRADAESLVRRLTSRGVDARVSGDVAPFRVRVGRWATRAEASRELAALKAKGQNGWVAEEQVEGTR